MKLTIIIDKNILMGEPVPRLCALVKRHTVVLMPELLYECATGKESRVGELFSRINVLLGNGAYVGLDECDIVLGEIRTLKTSQEIINYEMTDRLREDGLPPADSIGGNQIFSKVLEGIKWRKEMAQSISEEARNNHPQVLKDECKACGKLSEYFAKYVHDIDNDFDITRIRKWVVPAAEKLTSHIDRDNYCTSNLWFSWQSIRLVLVLGYVHAIRIGRNMPLADETFERDCMDAGYVVRLTIADVLVSNDHKCTIPLARAAYPEKRVYTALTDCE